MIFRPTGEAGTGPTQFSLTPIMTANLWAEVEGWAVVVLQVVVHLLVGSEQGRGRP